MKEYRLNSKILKSLFKENLILIIGVFVILLLQHYLQTSQAFYLDIYLVEISIVIIFLFNLPGLFILFNYYLENRNTILLLKRDQIEIKQNNRSKVYNFSDVEYSVYHLGKYYQNRIDNAMRWKMISSDLAYWDLKF